MPAPIHAIAAPVTWRVLPIVLPLMVYAAFPPISSAGLGLGIGQQRAVGGVIIDPAGEVRAATPEEQHELADLVRVAVDPPTGEIAQAAKQRVISLKGLQTQLRELSETGGELTPELAFLGGLKRVETVVVDADNQDLLLIGPAGPWKLLPDGSVVSADDGSSVVRLDDLITAFRSVETARRDGGIRCSIEPTDEGRARLQSLLSRVKLQPGQNPAFLEASMREAFGPQQVLLAGVPTDSRFARTLVAADFEMKRIAMALIESPVAGLPSYLELAKNQRQTTAQNPRWWMACHYEPIAREATGRVWKLSGQGVKTLTEQDIVAADGSVKADGRRDPMAVKWADLMTEHYTELAHQKTVFQDLRNAMDLAVVATLVRQENLDGASGIDLSVIRGETSSVAQVSYAMPTQLQPQCSFVHGRAGWTVTASGGVNINAFAIAASQVTDETLTKLNATASKTDRWWWDVR